MIIKYKHILNLNKKYSLPEKSFFTLNLYNFKNVNINLFFLIKYILQNNYNKNNLFIILNYNFFKKLNYKNFNYLYITI